MQLTAPGCHDLASTIPSQTFMTATLGFAPKWWWKMVMNPMVLSKKITKTHPSTAWGVISKVLSWPQEKNIGLKIQMEWTFAQGTQRIAARNWNHLLVWSGTAGRNVSWRSWVDWHPSFGSVQFGKKRTLPLKHKNQWGVGIWRGWTPKVVGLTKMSNICRGTVMAWGFLGNFIGE